MQNLSNFLTKIQAFELRMVTKGELFSPIMEAKERPAYSLIHETQYYNSFSYYSEIRVLKDMALMDLLSLSDQSIKKEVQQLIKLKDRFKLFWTNFHQHYSELKSEYPSSYIFSIHLDFLFIVNNLQPDHTNIFIGDEFVESLNDSVKLREKFLTELINDLDDLLNPKETFEEWKARLQEEKQNEDTEIEALAKIPYNADAGLPKFKEQFIEDFLQLMKSYFSEAHHEQLSSIVHRNEPSETQLIFIGNGNQLADAFKQLYEANLIVGCKKSDLEKWIARHFLYATGDTPKEYTEGWLSSIISTDTKICKSPILEVRIKDNFPTIIPTIRNKKNSKY